jgi:hypothetical protein
MVDAHIDDIARVVTGWHWMNWPRRIKHMMSSFTYFPLSTSQFKMAEVRLDDHDTVAVENR